MKQSDIYGFTVHQADLSIEERILRHFDLCSEYGVSCQSVHPVAGKGRRKQADRISSCQPCIGIARIKRWRRAHALGLNPPIEVLAALLKEETRAKTSEKAYIDELLS